MSCGRNALLSVCDPAASVAEKLLAMRTFLFTWGHHGANAEIRRGGAQDGKGFAGDTTTLMGP
jgi:hypothetical protein